MVKRPFWEIYLEYVDYFWDINNINDPEWRSMHLDNLFHWFILIYFGCDILQWFSSLFY